MKWKSRSISGIVLTCLVLVVSMAFSSCNKGAEEKQVTTEKNGTNALQKEIDPFGKYDETVVLTTIVGRDVAGGDFEAYKDPDETFENNRWVKLIKEKLNIKVDYVAIIDKAQLEQKRKIMIASGSIPDFFTSNDVEISQLTRAEAIQPVGDIFDNYASEMVSSLYDMGGNSIWVPTTLKGERMAIPNVGAGEAMNQAKMLWIRRDWLRNLELEEPKTLDDLINVATQFTKNDPDQDGKNNTYGIGLTSDISSVRSFMTGIFNSYEAYPYIWLKDNSGELYYGLLDPNVKKALEGMSKLYEDGVLDVEFAIKDDNKIKEDIASGKVGIISSFHAGALQLGLGSLKENEPDSDFIAIKLPAKTTIPADNPAAVVISKECDNPEAVVKIMNLGAEMYYKSEEADREYYIQNEHGLPGLTLFPAPQPLVVGKNPKNSILINEALKAGTDDPEAFYNSVDTLVPKGDFLAVYGNVTGYINNETPAKYPWYLLFGPEGSELVLDDIAKNNLYIQNAYMGSPTQTMIKKQEVLNKLQDETILRIIMGEDSIDKYDKLVEDWKKLGGEQITEEVNQWVKENQ
jgi:putative aldouronate transport system substrate-binding protein